jgi:hypothetical protein
MAMSGWVGVCVLRKKAAVVKQHCAPLNTPIFSRTNASLTEVFRWRRELRDVRSPSSSKPCWFSFRRLMSRRPPPGGLSADQVRGPGIASLGAVEHLPHLVTQRSRCDRLLNECDALVAAAVAENGFLRMARHEEDLHVRAQLPRSAGEL